MLTTTYYGIFSSGMKIEKPALELVNQVPGVQYIIKYQDNREKGNNWALHTLITSNGEQQPLSIGNFEVIDVGKEQLHFGRLVTYNDKRTKIKRQFHSSANGELFLFKDVLPLLSKLNEIGSFEMYDKLIELDNLKAENQTLKNQVQTLTKQLEAKASA